MKKNFFIIQRLNGFEIMAQKSSEMGKLGITYFQGPFVIPILTYAPSVRPLPERWINSVALKHIQTNPVLVYDHFLIFHEKIPCSFCGEMVGKKYMNRHIGQKHTENGDRKHKCTICGKGFIDKKGLQDHINTHTGIFFRNIILQNKNEIF